MEWAHFSGRGIILWVIITMYVCPCVCVCVYPVCLGHEETLRHPWASGGVVVHQIGVSSLEQSKDAVIPLRFYQAVGKQFRHYLNRSSRERVGSFFLVFCHRTPETAVLASFSEQGAGLYFVSV